MKSIIWLIAVGVVDKNIVSYRLLEYSTVGKGSIMDIRINKVCDVKAKELKEEMKQGKIDVVNAKVEDDKVVGTRGKLKGYAKYDGRTGRIIENSLVVLGYNDLGKYIVVNNIENSIQINRISGDELFNTNDRIANIARKHSKNGKQLMVGIRFTLDLIEREKKLNMN